MNKILITILIAIISIPSFGQRKSKNKKLPNKSYLLLKVLETNNIDDEEIELAFSNMIDIDRTDDQKNEIQKKIEKEFLYQQNNIKVRYEHSTNINKNESNALRELEQESQSIAHAVNGASKLGWQIISTNVTTLKNQHRIHYIYMSK